MRRSTNPGITPSTLLGALLLLTACASGNGLRFPGPERSDVALSGAAVAAVAEILGLEDRRVFDPEAFTRLASSASSEVRRRAVTAAGRIGDAAATPLLLRTLRDDRDPAVRADAAFALGELGDTAAVVVQALRAAAPARWAPVRDEETTVLVEVLGALGRIGTEAAGDGVADALRASYPARDRHSTRIAAEALLASWRFPGGRAVGTGSITPFLGHPDPELRWRAAYALMRLSRSAAVRPLLRAVSDPDHRVRALAARGLRPSLADSAGVRADAVVALDSALSDPHPHVRINALGALATYGEEAPMAAIRGRLADEDRNVAIAAAAALGALGARAVDPLAAVAADTRVPRAVRAAAVAQLARLDAARAWPTIEAWSRGEPASRYAAARALAPVGWERARVVLDRLARDEDVRVAVAALQAAGEMAGDSALAGPAAEALHALLLEIARSPEPRRRAAARGGLGPAADTLTEARGAEPMAAAARDADFYREIARRYVAAPLAGQDRPRARIRTAVGEFTVELLAEEAPLTVHNFVSLAEAGFFDGGVWHRVVPNFVLQDGAPAGYAEGGPGWTIRDEINRVRYTRGTMGMALDGPDTGGSQWFITHSAQPHLDGGYTVFGRVVDGMDVADRVAQGDPILSIDIRR